jgi:hypothetical protein
MSLTAECPTCARTGDVPDIYRGRRVRCRQCGTFFIVAPASTDSLSLLSPRSSGEAENASDPPDSDEVIAVRVSRARKPVLRLDSAVVMGVDGRLPH